MAILQGNQGLLCDHLSITKSQLLKTLKKKPFENIVGKGENAGNQYFFLLPQYFLPSQNKFQFFNHIYFVVFKCFQFRPVQSSVIQW